MAYERQFSNKVPGTGRREWYTPHGELLHYRHIYLTPLAWEVLKDIASSQGISGSQAIERLISKAAGFNVSGNRQH